MRETTVSIDCAEVRQASLGSVIFFRNRRNVYIEAFARKQLSTADTTRASRDSKLEDLFCYGWKSLVIFSKFITLACQNDMEFNTNAYGESRRRKVSSVIPPDVDANSMRCCRNISNTDAAVSTKGLSICRHSKRRIHLSGKDSMQLKENKSSQKSSEQMHSSPFGKYDIQKSKHQSSSWRPVRKTQRSMSAHSAATPGPDSAVLRDPLTGKIYKRGKLLGKVDFVCYNFTSCERWYISKSERFIWDITRVICDVKSCVAAWIDQ